MASSMRRIAIGQAVIAFLAHAAVLSLILRHADLYVQQAGAVTLVACPALVAHQYGLALLQGSRNFFAYNVQRTLPVLLYSGGLALVYASGTSDLFTVTLVWVSATAACGALTLIVALLIAERGHFDSLLEAPAAREARAFGRRALLGTFAGFEQLQLDQALVALMLSSRDLGLYVVALAFSNLPRLIASSIGIVAFPAVAAARARGVELRELLRFTMLALFVCSAVIGVLELAVPSLTRLFFGSEFSEAGELARILLLAALFQSVRRVMADGARGAGQPGLGSAAELASWVIFLPAALLLSKLDGLIGFGYAVVLASAGSLTVVGVGLAITRRGTETTPRLPTPVDAELRTDG
jgi:O-antigen/teichoic acid export membrane protein